MAQRFADIPELHPLEPLWEAALDASPAPYPLTYWCHGDLHPGNYMLNLDGSLKGLIDFGDLTTGDPALDLSAAWSSFAAPGHRLFLESYLARCTPDIATDSSLMTRAQGWCIAAAIAPVLASDLSTPDFVGMARWAKLQLLGK